MTNAEPLILDQGLLLKPARVRRVSVKKLFGWLNHDVELRREERVTILLGPNGVGKTRLLELIAAVAHGRIDQLVSVPFEELRIDFDDDRALVVRRRQGVKPTRVRKPRLGRRLRRVQPASVQPVEFLLFVGETQKVRWAPEENTGERADPSWNRASHLPPWLKPANAGRWFDQNLGRVLTSQEVVEIYGIAEELLRLDVKLPEWLGALFHQSPVHLIETQRLVRWQPLASKHADVAIDEVPVALAVEEVAEELARRVAIVQSDYAREAQRLEKTYIERLLRPREVSAVSVPELRARLDNLAERRTRLETLGLLAADEQEGAVPSASMSREQVPVLDLFAADLEHKLDVLEPLARSVELLVGSVNAKFRNKKLRLSQKEGLVVECKPDDRRVDVQSLSSGEQHELVLLFDLIFRVQKNTLVMIDEPELSLHPEWQMQFVEDLWKIAQNSQFDVMLATHSPYIVGNRNDLCVALRSEPEE